MTTTSTSTSRADADRPVTTAKRARDAEAPTTARGRTRTRARRAIAVRFLVLIAAVVGLAVGAVLYLLPVRYSATAESFVSLSPQAAAETDPYAGSVFVLQRMQTYAELGTSAPVLNAVLADTGVDRTLLELQSEVTTETQPQTVLLTVTVTDTDPKVAAALANSILIQQARAVEAYDADESVTDAPVRVTPTSAADVPESKPAWFPIARSGVVAVVTAGVVLAGLLVLRRWRARTRRRNGRRA